jgi:hypothetical protein
VSKKKYRSSKHGSDDEPSEHRKGGEIPKQREPYGQEEEKREVVRGRERQVHEEIIARRLGGGEPPSPEAYKHALDQWQQLPGSVIRSPTDVIPPATEPKSADESQASRSTSNDKDQEEG